MQADADQALLEWAARAIGEDARHTGILAAQQEGPLRRFVIPNDSNRKSRSPLFYMCLIDSDVARAMDFEHIKSLLSVEGPDGALDEVPIDMLGDYL